MNDDAIVVPFPPTACISLLNPWSLRARRGFSLLELFVANEVYISQGKALCGFQFEENLF